MHRPRAKLLYTHGFKTLEDIVLAGASDVARVLSESKPYGDEMMGARSIQRLAEAIVRRARSILLKKVEG